MSNLDENGNLQVPSNQLCAEQTTNERVSSTADSTVTSPVYVSLQPPVLDANAVSALFLPSVQRDIPRSWPLDGPNKHSGQREVASSQEQCVSADLGQAAIPTVASGGDLVSNEERPVVGQSGSAFTTFVNRFRWSRTTGE